MKITEINNQTKSKLSTIAAAFLLFIFFGACATKATFPVSSVIPAAEGNVKVKQDKNDNYEIQVEVNHMAPPSRLNPPKKTYVVWIETDRSGVENIGRLEVKKGIFASARKGSLETVSSYKPEEVFITAEDDPNVQYPSMQEVLRTDID